MVQRQHRRSAPGMARHRHHRSAHKVWLSNAMAELTNLPCLVLSCCVVSCLVLYCRVLCGVVLICVVLYVLWCRAMSTPSETGSCLCVCVCWGMYACMYAGMHACMYLCMHVCIWFLPDAGRRTRAGCTLLVCACGARCATESQELSVLVHPTII